MDIKILASRSGETVVLKSVVVFVIHCCHLYLIRGIYLSLLHTIVIFVYERMRYCHLLDLFKTIEREK